MDVLQNKLDDIEQKFNIDKSSESAIAVAMRCWLLYKAQGDKAHLYKGYHINRSVFKTNFACFDHYFIDVFLSIEMENFDNAKQLLDLLKGSKNYFKNNEPQRFMLYTFLNGFYNIRLGKIRAFEKQQKTMNDFRDNTHNGLFDMLMAVSAYEYGDYNGAVLLFAKAYAKGERSAMMFAYLLDCFNNAPVDVSKVDDGMFFGFVRWALNKKLDISEAVFKFKYAMAAYFNVYPKLVEEVYRLYPHDEVLASICSALMERMDYSSSAFYFYKEAELKQIELPNIYNMLIKSAANNNVENISRYTLDMFFKTGYLEAMLLPFAYHLVITKPKNFELLDAYKDRIIDFAVESLKKGESGRYYNSIYRFYLSEAVTASDKSLMDLAEKILWEDLFKFRVLIENDSAKYIWVSEPERRDMNKYAITGKSKVIIASGPSFSCWFLDSDQRSLVETPYTAVRLVENADIELYKRFFGKGMTSPELIVALSKHYMSLEVLPEESIGVFKLAVARADLSASFKMLISAATGNYYASLGAYSKAVSYYKDVDENKLNDNYIEQMLIAYINANDYKKAVSLIVKKAECISDRNLFYALKQIAVKNIYDRDIANVAYELVLKSWYDKTLVEIIFSHYRGSQEEWQELSRALSHMSIAEQGLDEIILKNAIVMHQMDKGSQKVFQRMFEMNSKNTLVEEFVAFCVYEIIINNIKPEYETIEIMERMFFGSGDSFIAYALCHVYARYGITTFKSDEIIKQAVKLCEDDAFIFPVLKHIKDKKFTSAYIEKNQPFIYHGFPDKIIKLYYKTDNEPEFRSKRMRYLRFGLYFAHVTHFYGEKITYYFSEEMETGSIVSKQSVVENSDMKLSEIKDDSFFVINNALIYERLFKYDMVEGIITEKLREKPRIKSWIL